MPTLGIMVRPSGRPKLECVLVAGTRENPSVIEAFDLKAADDNLIDQIHLLGNALASRLAALPVDSAVIRTADFSPVARRGAAVAIRHMLEGAVAFVCRERLSQVELRTGKDVGERLGVEKDSAAGLGRALDAKRAEAAAAAISGLE